MQIEKQLLKLHLEQWTGSKLGKEYFKAIYCHPAYLASIQIDYILCSQRWRNSIQSAKSRPGADCGSDHELLIAKFGLKLKKVGKTTRPFSMT